MKKILGVSLTELVVTVAIVSVIGAGAFVGVQQLNEAQNQAQSRAAQMANAQLLLPLIEMEQARHGQQVINPDPICLIHHDGTAWKHSCVEGDEVPAPAQGFLTCRVLESGKAQRTAMYFSSALDPDSDPEKTSYRLFRQTFESNDCDLSKPDLQTEGFYNDTPNFDLNKHDTLTGVGSRFVLSDEVKSFEVNFSADGLTVENSISFIAGKTLVTEGNTTRIEDNQLDFDTSVTPSLTEDDRPVFSLGTETLIIASGNDAQVYVYSDRPVFEDTKILWALGSSSGTEIIYAGQTRTSAPIKISNASASGNLILLPSEDYLTDEFAELVIQEKENFKPDVRARLSANRLIYGGPAETIEVFLTGQASGATKIELEIDQASCDEPEADPVVLEYSSSDTCLIPVQISDGETTPSSETRIKAAASGTDKLITAAFQAASGSNYYGLAGTPELSFELVSDLPEISFLSSTSKSIRAASGSKKHRVILLSDQALSRDITVNLSIASGASADCSDDYQIPDQTDCDGSYETTFPAGRFEHEFEIDIKPDAANDDKESFELAIDEGSYAVDSDKDEHTVELLQYSVVSFASASISNVDESQSTLSIPLTLSPKAENEVKLYFSSAAADATSNQFTDWTFASSSNPLIASGTKATLTLKFDDDTVPEGVEKIAITLDEDKFIGEVIAASGSQSVITTLDNNDSEYCLPSGFDPDTSGGGTNLLNITASSANSPSFYLKNTADLTATNLGGSTGGTVQIADGFQSGDELKTRNASSSTENSDQTTITYVNSFAATDSKTYTLESEYTYATGVLKITVASGSGVGAGGKNITPSHMVKFFNEHVELDVADFGSSSTRDIVFTLGDAQSWDRHEDKTVHYYRFVEDDGSSDPSDNKKGINWKKAFVKANAENYFGVDGYLATVTSRAENNFLGEKFKVNGQAKSGWLGGSNRQNRPPGLSSDYAWPTGLDAGDHRWGWVNGPEFGRVFWSGLGGCGDPIEHNSDDSVANKVDIFPYEDGDEPGWSESDISKNRCAKNYGGASDTNWLPHNATWAQSNDFLNCVQHNEYLNNNSEMSDPMAPRQMVFGYHQKQSSEADEPGSNGSKNEFGSSHFVDPSRNTYRFSNFGCTRWKDNEFHQPDFSGSDEFFLQMTGMKNGGFLWNDLRNNPTFYSADDSSDRQPYSIYGYYIEWGGKGSDYTMEGLKLSQTNTVTPYKCQVKH